MELHVALGPPVRGAIVVLGLAGFLLVAYLLEGSPDDAASLAGLSFVGALVALRLAFVITTLIARRRGDVAVRIDSNGITRIGQSMVPWSRIEDIRVRYFWGPFAHPRRWHRRSRVIQFVVTTEREFAARAGIKARPGFGIAVINYDTSLDDVLAAIQRYSNLPIHVD